MSSMVLERSAWPLAHADAALVALGIREGLVASDPALHHTHPPEAPRVADIDDDPTNDRLRARLGDWLELHASRAGAELEPVEVPLGQLEDALARLGPALLLLDATTLGGPSDGNEGRAPVILALDRRARLLGPDLRRRKIPRAELAAALGGRRVAPVREECERLLDDAEIPARRRARALQALLVRRLASTPVRGIWLLRGAIQAPLHHQLRRREGGIRRSLLTIIAAHVCHYLLVLASWWLIGRGVLHGRSDPGWLLAWGLLLLSLIPLRAARHWHGGLAAMRIGAALKRRMLAGALALGPDELRSRGSGRLLAMVIEAEAVEGLAVSSGLTGATALIDLAVAGWVLTQGAGGAVLLPAFLAWTAVLGIFAWRYAVARRAWTRGRLRMTHGLVERMVGHTTRLAQEDPRRWHDREDASTVDYVERSRTMDRVAADIGMIAQRGWMLIGAVGLWPALAGEAPDPAALAVAFGGLMLARGALSSLSAGLGDLVDLSIAWREVGPLVTAGARRSQPPRFSRAERAHEPERRGPGALAPVLEARELAYRYPGREQPALRDIDLRLHRGERVLLEGPSGGGKSTLAALLAGLRAPTAGLLLLEGLDRPTHGELGWRERVATAPQFHLNHVLTNTFAFNLLMGRRWPPTREDMEQAEAICQELGLGPLLQRMPAGMLQVVGENGWQLSHGERSRVYLARALLQGAELVILDESFAALDPANQELALRCAFEHAPTLLVIAHP